MANKSEKTYSRPTGDELANKFTINLAGLKLSPEQLDTVRNHALRSALLAAAGVLKGIGDRGAR